MAIQNLFDNFSLSILELDSYANIVETSYYNYLEKIEEQKVFYSKQRPVYFDIRNNNETTISDLILKKTSKDRSEDIYFHYNRQMQWFLVEAYEMYEKFVEELYVTLGTLDINFWNLTDFGEIQLNDIHTKENDWFYQQIKKKKDKPYSILKVFEERFHLASYSNKNVAQENYQFLMKLIAEFRHAIVHHKGFLDKTSLINKLIKQSGINGDPLKKEYEGFINYFYGRGNYNNLISLTKIEDETTQLPINYDRRIFLSKYILSYANLLTQLSLEYLEENNIK